MAQNPNRPIAPTSVPPKNLPRPQVLGKGPVPAPLTGKSK